MPKANKKKTDRFKKAAEELFAAAYELGIVGETVDYLCEPTYLYTSETDGHEVTQVRRTVYIGLSETVASPKETLGLAKICGYNCLKQIEPWRSSSDDPPKT